ncbi:MAG: 3D domain-containing protein [Bacteroidales bacterium]|nr:3D domain-containing protein [Bacteroidales bacterium]
MKEITIAFLLVLLIAACATHEKHTLTVTATAYNTLPRQTNRYHSLVGAWGDSLKPGMKVIAVSRDLIKKGLHRGQKVKIKGLKGKYTVMDKMNKRWAKRIDIYMGNDKEKALEWGKKKVEITWYTPAGNNDN